MFGSRSRRHPLGSASPSFTLPARLLIPGAAALVAVDQAAKLWVQSHVPLHGEVPLVGETLRLSHYVNRGAVGGIGRDLPWTMPALILGGLLLILLLLGAYRLHRAYFGTSWRVQGFVALSVAAVACTSLDRVRLGYVVDFLHIPGLPVFNFGDLLPHLAVILIALEMAALIQRRRLWPVEYWPSAPARRREPAKPTSSGPRSWLARAWRATRTRAIGTAR